MNPLHAALTSNAPQRSPSSCCTAAAEPGTVRSGVVVAGRRASISAGSTPDISSAWRPDSIDRPTVVPPTWRSRMPVRSTIHSSDVSNICSRSWLVSTFGGRAVPHPVMTAPRVAGLVSSAWDPLFLVRQFVRSQAIGWRSVTRSPGMAM